MIEGFVGLLTYLEARDGVICVIARKLNQDSLESLFGQLRFNCGSGRDPSMFKTIHAMSRVETQRVVRRGVRYAQARRRTSGQTGDSEPVRSSGVHAQATGWKRARGGDGKFLIEENVVVDKESLVSALRYIGLPHTHTCQPAAGGAPSILLPSS